MPTEFWKSCLKKYAQELPQQQVTTWIRPLALEGDVEGGLRLVAANGFTLKWVKEKYLSGIEAHAAEFFGKPVKVALVIGKAEQKVGNGAEDAPVEVLSVHEASPKIAVKANGKPKSKSTASKAGVQENDKTRLNRALTFENLVVGKANDLARAAAERVATSPGGNTYNPLFIYGGAGLGKTHLMHAIGNHIASQFPEKVVRYVHTEDYYSDVVKAYQQKAFDALKRYYRSLDVLLLDDVQFLQGKDRSQQEFFFVFNALLEAKKQIIITCDTYPKNINGLEERLVSRFDWGLTVQIEPPEIEMRVAILKKKAEAEGLTLGDDVAFFIAKYLRSNVRELEGALNRVLAYSRFRGMSVTLEVAREALKDIVNSVRNVSIEDIQKTVADYYKIKVADLFSQKRTRAIARPRQIAMWLCKEVTQFSYPNIGDAFGGRDHTTVIHAVKNIEQLRTTDSDLNHALHVLVQTVKG
ncbi:chromosomal replication initiator protein DnaA [Betaproteobacteria bacterium]|nr:chromosomal replication initiator protein DnaA [Betaproteobacteria bacterium]GHU46219.1 chromosomal replication initiator protein DnaA [Betaproteobacteria bacterium]